MSGLGKKASEGQVEAKWWLGFNNVWIYLSACSCVLLPCLLSSSIFSSTSVLYVPNQLFNRQFSQAVPPTLPTARLVAASDNHSLSQTAASANSEDPARRLPGSASPRQIYRLEPLLSTDALRKQCWGIACIHQGHLSCSRNQNQKHLFARRVLDTQRDWLGGWYVH